jgi:predicted nucleotidyltransferase
MQQEAGKSKLESSKAAGLNPEVMDELTRRLVEELQPERVILFGSHAWGAPNEHSDVDFLVIVSQSDESSTQRAMRAHRCLRHAPVPVDVMVKTSAEVERASRVHSSLISEILEQGRSLYG